MRVKLDRGDDAEAIETPFQGKEEILILESSNPGDGAILWTG